MMSACQSGGCGGGTAPRMPPPPTFSEVRVNGVEIDPDAIAREIQHHPAPDGETAWTEAARALAIRELLLQEAERLSVTAEPEADEASRLEAEPDAVIAALLDREVVPQTPDEDECRRFYDAQKVKFRTADLFEASHILIEPEGGDQAAWAAAEAQADAVIAEVGDDPAAFAKAARDVSSCPSAAQDGSLGQVRRGELVPQVQKVLERLKPGWTHRAPVRSKFGWHVLRLQRRIEGQELPFEVVRDRIADTLEARSWSIEAARYVGRLAQQAQVEGITIEPDTGSGAA
ncbi:peptidylprolyl isomerase [Paracoccus rhizosphaerae]|uniref:Parvulin-like PPIase n=2 Tax=Paracoccus rhizosphaerae TaxID=1133347 RepID=A0ABV6CFR3_9RHOB|nr:peptidylprolyl isomerase [Paracoccus rhizosphaerae]